MPDQPTPRILKTASDVTSEILEVAESINDDWFADEGQVDWEDFIDRLADPHGYNDKGAGAFDFEDYWNPAINKIKKHIRQYRREG